MITGIMKTILSRILLVVCLAALTDAMVDVKWTPNGKSRPFSKKSVPSRIVVLKPRNPGVNRFC